MIGAILEESDIAAVVLQVVLALEVLWATSPRGGEIWNEQRGEDQQRDLEAQVRIARRRFHTAVRDK